MKNRYQPYNFNEKYEMKTYRYVGKDYGDRKIANRGVMLNFRRWFRKKRNKTEKEYKFCNTYSEWKNHIEEIFPTENNCEKENFVHWLERQKRYAKAEFEAVKIILIPIYIAGLSIDDLFMRKNVTVDSTGVFGTLIVVVILSVIFLEKTRLKKEFYEDLIQVAEKM